MKTNEIIEGRRYFIGQKEVSYQAAKEANEENQRRWALFEEDPRDMDILLGVQFIVVI